MSRKVISQIYGISSLGEALAVINAGAGAEHIGLNPRYKGLPPDVDGLKLCKEIIDGVRGKTLVSLILLDEPLEDCLHFCEYCKPDIVHISGWNIYSTPQFVTDVKAAVPGIRVMQAIPMGGPEAVDLAKKYAEFCDFLLLDTVLPGHKGIGAVGKIHDWALDKAIVDAVDIPVIIAGGLGPDNVVDAINYVKPYGVDSLTKTNQVRDDGLRVKDINLVAAFNNAVNSVRVED